MKFRIFFTAIFTLLVSNIEAQKVDEDILFKVDNTPVYSSEFIRVYNKNLDLVQDESQKDVDEYLTLFTNYKLKLKEAKALKLDEKESYKRELANYKKQLTKNFISDSKVTDALIEEAYQRISYDIKANHILIRLQESASPEDTLKAYNTISKLRERALSEGFEKVRKEVHNGQTVFGEELGYFSGFKMVYKFESIAFNTQVGEVSQPFRTRFGYHIVNVLDKKKSQGTRTVAHIMVVDKKGDTIGKSSEIRINEIYKKIEQGESFESLAKQFSDDKNSAPKGGTLQPFSSGQLSSKEFEDVAFGLENKDDISKPVKTKFGWHIVKLINKKPIAAFEDMKTELESKVKRDSRSKLIDKALHDKLKAKYNVSHNQQALNYFTSLLNENYYKRAWTLPKDFTADKSLVKIGDKELSYSDFGDFLVKNQRGLRQKEAFNTIVQKAYDTFLNTNLVTYQEDNLEYENKEFAHVLSEYRDGLLLFDLMESTIWNTAKTDSLGLQDFYNTNKNNYKFPKRIDAVVASSSKQKTLKKVSKLLKQDTDLDEIKKQINTNDEVQVIFTSDTMDKEHQALPKGLEFKKGVSKIYKHNSAYVIVKVNDVFPETQKTFEEAKGSVISDYQNYKEENWVKELGEKYNIEINQEVLTKVKSQIKNQ